MNKLIVRFLLWSEYKIYELRDRYDKCHICQEPAELWCENCEHRHCYEHEWGGYEDVNCCVNCAPTEEELQEIYTENGQ